MHRNFRLTTEAYFDKGCFSYLLMKIKKIYLIVNDNDKRNKYNITEAAGVFFNKKNAQCFVKQLVQENKVLDLNKFVLLKYKFLKN